MVALELRAGIIGGHWTPRAAHQASFLVAHMTPREGAETLRELGNMNPSKSSLDRLPKQLSKPLGRPARSVRGGVASAALGAG